MDLVNENSPDAFWGVFFSGPQNDATGLRGHRFLGHPDTQYGWYIYVYMNGWYEFMGSVS